MAEVLPVRDVHNGLLPTFLHMQGCEKMALQKMCRETPSLPFGQIGVPTVSNLPILFSVLTGVEDPAGVSQSITVLDRGMQDQQPLCVPEQRKLEILRGVLMCKGGKVRTGEVKVMLQDTGLKEGQPKWALQVINYYRPRPGAAQPKPGDIKRPVRSKLRQIACHRYRRHGRAKRGPAHCRVLGVPHHRAQSLEDALQSFPTQPNVQAIRGQIGQEEAQSAPACWHTLSHNPRGACSRTADGCSGISREARKKAMILPHAGISEQLQYSAAGGEEPIFASACKASRATATKESNERRGQGKDSGGGQGRKKYGSGRATYKQRKPTQERKSLCCGDGRGDPLLKRRQNVWARYIGGQASGIRMQLQEGRRFSPRLQHGA